MTEIPAGWSGDATRIARTYRFQNFSQAIAFMVEASFYCERVDHHPEWTNVYNRVAVELTTHDVGAVTDKDLALAAHLDAVFSRAWG